MLTEKELLVGTDKTSNNTSNKKQAARTDYHTHTLLSVLSKRLRVLSSPDMTESGIEEKRALVQSVAAADRCCVATVAAWRKR
jgi:hypothetical protein